MKKGDWIVIAVVVMLSLLPLARLPHGKAATRVTIAVNGEIVYAGRLNRDAVVEAGAGNTVRVQDGHVRMARADCPDGVCLSGEATATRPLVCLPNGVVVTVENGEEALDGLTY